MTSLLFLVLLGLSAWTGIALFRKSPKSEDIRVLLREIGKTTIVLLQNFLNLLHSIKTLFNILSEESLEAIESKDTTSKVEKVPNLIKVKESEQKKAA
tara:strand:+ start:61 stop:354 length:294 start_codon:yes stop_codon:yes gene_type:complete